MLSVVNADGTTETGSLIDDIVREGARRMLAAALEAEVNTYIAKLTDQRDDHGRRLVVRNGYHQARMVTTAAGVVEVKAPRVNDKRIDAATGERMRFFSAIVVAAVGEEQHGAVQGAQQALPVGEFAFALGAERGGERGSGCRTR